LITLAALGDKFREKSGDVVVEGGTFCPSSNVVLHGKVVEREGGKSWWVVEENRPFSGCGHPTHGTERRCSATGSTPRDPLEENPKIRI